MASCRPLSYQITHHAGCQCSISHEQHRLPSEYSIIHDFQDHISSQAPHCSNTVQAFAVRPHCRQGLQSNQIPPLKGTPCYFAHRQGHPQHIQQISICDQRPLIAHGYYDLGPSIHERVRLEKHAERTSGNQYIGLDDTGLRESTPIEISSGTQFTLYCGTVGDCLSRRWILHRNNPGIEKPYSICGLRFR